MGEEGKEAPGRPLTPTRRVAPGEGTSGGSSPVRRRLSVKTSPEPDSGVPADLPREVFLPVDAQVGLVDGPEVMKEDEPGDVVVDVGDEDDVEPPLESQTQIDPPGVRPCGVSLERC